MNSVWLNCQAGVAGDMLLGALIDAGADPIAVADILYGLNLDGWALTCDRVDRAGISATHAMVVEHHHDHDEHGDHTHHHRPYRDIVTLINAADIPERVKQRALATFRTLGEAEARVHGTTIDDVEFHEVGSIDAIIDIVGGQVPMLTSSMSALMPYVKSEKMRGIAVTGLKRSTVAPEFPTIAESGIPGFDVATWYCLLAPAGTPATAVERLRTALVEALAAPDVQQRLRDEGANIGSSTPAELTAFLRAEVENWGRAVQLSGARID